MRAFALLLAFSLCGGALANHHHGVGDGIRLRDYTHKNGLTSNHYRRNDLRAHTPTVDSLEALASARWTQHAYEGQFGQKKASFLLQENYVDTEESERKKMFIYAARQNAKKFEEESHHLYDGLLPEKVKEHKRQEAEYEERKKAFEMQKQKAAVQQVLIEEEQQQELQKQKSKTQASNTKASDTKTSRQKELLAKQKHHLRGAPKPVAKKKRKSIYPEAKRRPRMHTLHM